MNTQTKIAIIQSIRKNAHREIDNGKIIDIANEIEKIIDADLSKALMETFDFGALLNAFDLEIRSKK